jgi:hypothetical protein
MAYFAPVIPGLNLTYTYDRIAPPGNSGGVPINPGSLLDYLHQADNHKVFLHLVRTAQMDQIFNDIQADVTVFVPDDKLLLKKFPENVFLNMEKHQARQTISYNCLPRLINYKELISSRAMKLDTRIRGQPIYTNYCDKVLILNNTSRVIRPDLIVANALIHITDAFVIPEF